MAIIHLFEHAVNAVVFLRFITLSGVSIRFSDGYTLSDYSTPGTYTNTSSGNILTVTGVTTTPEPSSLALMLSGVGLVFAIRKRWASGLQQAS